MINNKELNAILGFLDYLVNSDASPETGIEAVRLYQEYKKLHYTMPPTNPQTHEDIGKPL